MNFTSNITSGLHDSMVIGNIFTEINRLVAQATSTVQVVVVLLGIIAALVIAAKGSWRINSIVIGVLVGGLLIWGAVAGVPWMADQAESTIGTAVITPALAG
ncbi:hypothetical protein AB0O26_09780 [Micrococcus luteus]|uniref:Uncharacterized protein n=1 Tax=Micrococcus sp. V7 TaxID=404582 RepID=U5NVV1_9MICC|nr:hypothetical protein [Micrococcus sp. V7]AGY35467.1 hypothetical protein LMV7_p00460 [Micrococcus sp. V7]